MPVSMQNSPPYPYRSLVLFVNITKLCLKRGVAISHVMINYYRRRPLYRMLASLWNNSPQALRVGGSSLTCVLPSSASRLLPAAPSVAQARAMGSKKRFSEITIEPYKTPRRKQARNQQLRDGKFPLKSEERIQRDLLMPMNPRSLGKIIYTHVTCTHIHVGVHYLDRKADIHLMLYSKQLSV